MAKGDFQRHPGPLPDLLLRGLLGLRGERGVVPCYQRTSSVMVKLLRTARNAGLVLFSALAMGEEVTGQQALGYTICLLFFGCYVYYKLTETCRGCPPSRRTPRRARPAVAVGARASKGGGPPGCLIASRTFSMNSAAAASRAASTSRARIRELNLH